MDLIVDDRELDFPEDAFELLASSEDKNFWFRSRNTLIKHLLSRYAPECGNLMEIGCGSGFVLRSLAAMYPQAEIHGAEYSVVGLQHAVRRVPGARFYRMDARSMPFREEFDLIGMFDVLEHIEEDVEVLQEMYRALKPAGILLVMVPQHMCLWSATDEIAQHKRRYSRRELEAKARSAGFGVVKSGSFMSLLFPAMWASRKLMSRDNAGESELQMNPALNYCFWGVSLFEILLRKIGIGFPFGGSLFSILRK